jgi:hypothetical protein
MELGRTIEIEYPTYSHNISMSMATLWKTLVSPVDLLSHRLFDIDPTTTKQTENKHQQSL